MSVLQTSLHIGPLLPDQFWLRSNGFRCVCACSITVGVQVWPFRGRQVLQVRPRGEAPGDGFRYTVSGQAPRSAAAQVVPDDDRDALRPAPARRRARRVRRQLPRTRDTAADPRRRHRLQTEIHVSQSKVRHVAQPVMRDTMNTSTWILVTSVQIVTISLMQNPTPNPKPNWKPKFWPLNLTIYFNSDDMWNRRV